MRNIDENKLEEMIMEELSASRLVEQYAEDISPFRSAVSKVIAGMVLTTITVSLLYLQYILPTIGIMLIYLGMRTLRRGNRFFKDGWLVSMVKLVLTAVMLILAATPWQAELGDWIGWLDLVLELLFLFCFGKGIQQASREAGAEKPKMPTLPVMVWKMIVTVLATQSYSGWLLIIAMLVLWCIAIGYICHCADDLKLTGYQVPAAPVTFSAKSILAGYILLLVIMLLVVTWVFGRAPLEGEVVQGNAVGGSKQAVEIRQDLIDMGFSEKLLSQILDEDLMDLEDAVAVKSGASTSGNAPLEGNVVAVQTERGNIKWFVLSSYREGYHAGLADSVKNYYMKDLEASGFYGRMFYTSGGVAYTAEIPLTEDSETYLWMGGETTDRWIEGKYSYPIFSKDQSSYFTWYTDSEEGSPLKWGMCSITFYCLTKYIVLPYIDLPYDGAHDLFTNGFSGMGEKQYHLYATPEFSE